MQNLVDLKKTFKNANLFDQALTHRSWVNENPGIRTSNERLEFLGDAVLELVVTSYLYSKLPDKPEGYLTALRANIVNTTNLAGFAKNMDLGKKIFVSKGEAQSNGVNNNSLLADTIEAIIGAIYIDQGLEIAQDFILDNLLIDFHKKIKEPLKDAKSMLQELVQAKSNSTPKYKVVKMVGPDHDREFTVQVKVNGEIVSEGIGKSKSEAEQKAANLALEKLKD